MKAKQKALALAEAVADKKGEDLQILDLRELCSFTDYFLIATGTSDRHLRTLAEVSVETSAKLGDKALGVEGQESARWILVDLGDVIVHLFREDAREFFGLERLWGEAEGCGATARRRSRALSGGGPVCLVVLDGFGVGDGGRADATALADTPFLRRARELYPYAVLDTSGPAVGLPPGQMGNSEVGHMTLGAGRVVEQDVALIQKAISGGELATNAVLQDLLARSERRSGTLHLLGLISDGCVHSSLDHLYGILDLLGSRGVRPVLHAFTDGRDTPPRSARDFVEPLEARLHELGGCIATVSGRYFAMDRDQRWDRVARAYRAIVSREGHSAPSGVDAIESAYARGENDEFIDPTVVEGEPPLADGDAFLFFNFRADRGRELTNALTRATPALLGREISELPKLDLAAAATLTIYDQAWTLPALFPQTDVPHSLGELVAYAGKRQLRIAETEKYAHVTYFFSGGREEALRRGGPHPDPVASRRTDLR